MTNDKDGPTSDRIELLYPLSNETKRYIHFQLNGSLSLTGWFGSLPTNEIYLHLEEFSKLKHHILCITLYLNMRLSGLILVRGDCLNTICLYHSEAL